jgi:hypothetical protein
MSARHRRGTGEEKEMDVPNSLVEGDRIDPLGHDHSLETLNGRPEDRAE